jgi:pimeloyl-ACP methyl ester carboxylesterase
MNNFKLVGAGPRKILLLPGLLGTRDAFDAMLAYADTATYQYACFEYRGYGEALHEAGACTLDEALGDIGAAVAQLDWGRFTVAGHSIGALLAQMLALQMPQHAQALVSLAGMSARGGARDPQRQQMLARAAIDEAQRRRMVDAGTGGHYGPGFASAVVQSTWHAIRPDAFAGYASDAARIDISAQVDGSGLPLLALVGEFDPVNTAALARETTLRWYRNARLDVLPGAGHYLMLEAPAACVSAIEAFAP